MHPVTERFLTFLDASPTPWHAVATAASRLEAAGFRRLDHRDPPEPLAPGSKRHLTRGGSILAFRVGAAPVAEAGFRLLAAHTDSPNLRIKPRPILRQHGYVRLGVEVYGGVTLATWTDRDLGLAGQVALRDGRTPLVRLDRPLCRIPNLAIHLNRDVNEKGLKLNEQTQMPALLALEEGLGHADPLRVLLAEALACDPADVLAWDLCLHDLTPATISGLRGEFLHSGRLDNLGSCHAGLEALLAACDEDVPAATAVLALFDHEEVGSVTERGAQSRLLEATLERIVRDATQAGDGGLTRALAHSFLVSADMAHAVHPGWADRHDDAHAPALNQGPVIKQNARARYATEAETAARFVRWCDAAEVPHQWFVNRSDLACGSTVGPLVAANLGVRTVDVGNPMLSMHSARELCGSADQPWMVAALRRMFLDGS